MSSLRQKIDKHFYDSSKHSAARELDHEGMLDEHMESMFRPTGSKVDVGRRMLGTENDMELAGAQYKGKKVSRSQLDQHSVSASSEEDSAEEFGESEMSEMSASSGSESMGELDRNAKIYNQMKGQDELNEDEEIDAALDQLKAKSTVAPSEKQSDTEKSQAVVTQKKILDAMLHQRILLQKALQSANKMPQNRLMAKFTAHNTKSAQKQLSAKRDLKRHLKLLNQCQKMLYVNSETNLNLKSLQE